MSSLVELRSKLAQAPTRLLLGISIMLISGFLANNLIQLNDASAVQVLVANTNLVKGQVLTISDVNLTTVSKSVDAGQWLTEKDLTSDVYLKSSLNAGDVLRRSDVQRVSMELQSISILLQVGRMPLDIEVGDSVDVWNIDGTPLLLARSVGITALELSGNEIVITLLVPEDKAVSLLTFQELAVTSSQ